MPNYKKNSKGFTLIELLVVILVIGALSGVLLGVVNSSGIRAKSRDAQRKAELKKVQTALELYFSTNRTYPISNGGGGANTWEEARSGATNVIVAALVPSYMSVFPADPTGNTGNQSTPCTTPTYRRFNYKSDGATYQLTTIMEVTTSNDESACGTAVGCAAGYATTDFCYLVVNP